MSIGGEIASLPVRRKPFTYYIVHTIQYCRYLQCGDVSCSTTIKPGFQNIILQVSGHITKNIHAHQRMVSLYCGHPTNVPSAPFSAPVSQNFEVKTLSYCEVC